MSTSGNLTMHFGGRLGNMLFRFASARGIAYLNNKTLVFIKDELNPPRNRLGGFLLKLEPTISKKEVKKTYQQISEHCVPMCHDQRFECLNCQKQSANYIMSGFFQSFRYFEAIEVSLREQLQFKSKIQQKIKKVFSKYPSLNKQGVTRIGIHVRRGDFFHYIKRGFVVAPIEYLQKAKKYMESLYDNAFFIVASNDIKWTKKALGNHSNHIYSQGLSAIEDLALLASCDHMIITTGTYSWWAGWLANGTTIYLDTFPNHNRWLGKNIKPEEYYPSHWIPSSAIPHQISKQ